MNTLIIRSDANASIGSGHIMRCLALAEAWQDFGGDVIFVLATTSPLLEQRLTSEAMEIQHLTSEPGSSTDAYETIRFAQDRKVKWIVVDGYLFGAEYQKIIKDSGLFLLFIDDYGHADHYYADIVLNQNIYADMSFYKKYEPYTRFLLGTNYVLLRREFLKLAGCNRIIPEIGRKVLVTLGGSDPNNISLSVIEALKRIKIDGLEVIAVVGGINSNSDVLKECVKDHSGFSIRKNINNMSELMAWADLIVSAGGSTTLEMAFMGLPGITINLAENQVMNSLVLYQDGIVENMGWYNKLNVNDIASCIHHIILSRQKRIQMSLNGKKIVDGNGIFRVIHFIKRDHDA